MLSFPMRPVARALVLLTLAQSLASCSGSPGCPPLLAGATRLVVVVADDMNGVAATLETYIRNAPDAPWAKESGPLAAVVGKAGLGWAAEAWPFSGWWEASKEEGDKRTPAGVFALGATFGVAPRAVPGYLTLAEGGQVCVDDLSSPHYGRIVTRAEAGPDTKGEEMWTVPLYRRGIVIDYPADRSRRSGSCIFIHVWEGAGAGTSGCVGAPEAVVARLQELADGGRRAGQGAIIAILPKSARALASCLPAG